MPDTEAANVLISKTGPFYHPPSPLADILVPGFSCRLINGKAEVPALMINLFLKVPFLGMCIRQSLIVEEQMRKFARY